MRRSSVLLSLLVAGGLFSGLATPASGQTLAGQLLDTSTGTAVPFSRVSLVTPDGRPVVFTFSDPQGYFALTAPEAGEYLVNAEALFYWAYTEGPVDLQATDTLMVEFGLTPHPSELEGIVVEARSRDLGLILNGFYEREHEGVGYHVDARTISQHSFHESTDILRSIPGVRLLETTTGDRAPVFARSQFWSSLQSGGTPPPCFPALYLDGQLTRMGGDDPPEIDLYVAPEQIQGMEVYTSPQQVPPAFAGMSSTCGVIAIWTKR